MQCFHDSLLEQFPTIEVIRGAYKTTSEGSPLRRVMFAQVMTGLRENAYKEVKGDADAPPYLATDLDELKDLDGFMCELGDVFKWLLDNSHAGEKVLEVEDYFVSEGGQDEDEDAYEQRNED